MQKIDMNSCFDDLAVQAGKGNPEAKEVLCRHFRKYIHNLSRSYQQGWDAEDAEQDLWVCFLECLLAYRKERKIHFRYYVLKYLRWKLLNFYRSRKLDEKYTSEFTELPCRSSQLERGEELTERETESVLEKCSLSNKQRHMVRQRLSGKAIRIWLLKTGNLCVISTTTWEGSSLYVQEIRNFEKVFSLDFQKTGPAVIYIVEGEMNGTSQGPG